MDKRIKIYTAMGMTGKMKNRLVDEANFICDLVNVFGFIPLNPVIEEKVENKPEPLEQTTQETLERFWKRDKEMIREADIVLDCGSDNKSDGVNVEVGYNRFGLWKPTVRVWRNAPINISRIEYDEVCDNLVDALKVIESRWGNYQKLGKWRQEMWGRCFPKWLEEQKALHERYEIQ